MHSICEGVIEEFLDSSVARHCIVNDISPVQGVLVYSTILVAVSPLSVLKTTSDPDSGALSKCVAHRTTIRLMSSGGVQLRKSALGIADRLAGVSIVIGKMPMTREPRGRLVEALTDVTRWCVADFARP